MQESPSSLSLGTSKEELNGHPVIQFLIHSCDEFYFQHWKDQVTGTYYCKIVYSSEERNINVNSTRFFNYFNDLDEYFINEIMWLYSRVTAN